VLGELAILHAEQVERDQWLRPEAVVDAVQRDEVAVRERGET
jgi:hypothetical protein